jgi:hypothetical protein
MRPLARRGGSLCREVPRGGSGGRTAPPPWHDPRLLPNDCRSRRCSTAARRVGAVAQGDARSNCKTRGIENKARRDGLQKKTSRTSRTQKAATAPTSRERSSMPRSRNWPGDPFRKGQSLGDDRDRLELDCSAGPVRSGRRCRGRRFHPRKLRRLAPDVDRLYRSADCHYWVNTGFSEAPPGAGRGGLRFGFRCSTRAVPLMCSPVRLVRIAVPTAFALLHRLRPPPYAAAEPRMAGPVVPVPLIRLTDDAATNRANVISPANRRKKSGPSASLAATKVAPTM